MPADRLRVAIDATALLEPRTGVGNVVHELLAGLAGRDDVEPLAFPVSVSGRHRLAAAVPDGVSVRTPPLPARALRALWARGHGPGIDAVIGRPDLVHGPNVVVPPGRAPRLATVHDLTALRFPELCTPDVRAYPVLLRRAIDRGAWIHTVSHAVADEVVDAFAVDADRVVAVPNGVTPVVGDAAEGRRLAGAARYVLAVGTVEPRKDLPGLVRALDRLVTGRFDPAAGDGRGELHDLVVVHAGGDGWGAADLEAAIASMARPAAFRRLGRVDDAALGHLYAGARVLAYPSVYEGFGLPVLEAMSAGVPVVTTDVAAVVEVAGDAALVVPVGDVDALAQALARAWTDDAWRAGAVDRGRARVAAHPWSATVEGVATLYRRVVDGSR